MNPTQIVFLFDLNAFSDVRPRCGPELHHKLLCLRLSCLRILTHYCTAVNLKWGFKFFDSCGKITQTMRKFSFSTVSLESYETLENEISVQYQRHASYLEALAVASEQNTTPSSNESVIYCQDKKLTTQVQLLQLALNEILCEFQWESSIDAFSPSVKSRNLRKGEKRNLLFLITRCAISDDEFQEFFGSDYASVTSVKLTKLLLSQSLQEQLLEKASILWIWLNTSENQISFKQYKPEVLKSLSDALKSIQCAVIPLSVLSQPTQILKFEKEIEGCVSETCSTGEVYSSIVPFSTLFLQSISYPFYMNASEESSESTIYFLQKGATVPIIINKVPFQWHRNKNNLSLQTVTSTNETSSDIVSRHWTKFTVHFAVPKHTQVKACDMFLCLPNVSKDISSCKKLQDLIKSLFLNNITLFLICESVCGTVRPGLFSPLSDTSAVISILDEKACFFLNETNSVETDKQFKVMSSLEIRKKIKKNVQSLTIDMNDKMESRGNSNKVSNPIKPFQMECLESWFEPASSAFSILSEIQQQQHSSSSALDAFHSKLFKSLKKKDLEEDIVQVSKSPEAIENEVTDEIYKDISYDQLIAMLTEIYNAALDPPGTVLHSAKKIVKLASTFFLQKSIILHEDSMKNFIAEFFSTTCRKLTEKYDNDQDPDSTVKKINECQMQVFLALEMEMLFPSLDGSSCVNTVTAFLRTMSFFSGATELNKFLSEVLKENYSQNLHSILVEVGDELDIPFDSDDDSLDEPLSFSSSFPDIFDSAFATTLSVRSSSSTTSSKSENRRLHRKRSDISDTHKSRQVLLPAKSPRKKKTKTHASGTDGIAIRCSPRLASKKKKEKFKTMDSKTETVRRNLFPRDKKPQTPRTSRSAASPLKKKRPHTPKGHHVLKTKFVADTPAHKQRHSALQRRKSQVNISPRGVALKEIAESPTIAKCSTDGTNLSLLQKLKERCAAFSSASSVKSLPSCSSLPPHTPESKRRLSLKLFSKLLTSPTARMGLKKCSKRLFDQVSPQVNAQSKKIKLSRGSRDSRESSEEI